MDTVSSGVTEAYALGFGEPVAISAEHGDGMADLHMALAAHVPAAEASPSGRTGRRPAQRARRAPTPGSQDELAPSQDSQATQNPIQLAVIGRPNVGKSTLINTLLGQERLLTGPEPGLTRDAISIEWRYKGRDFRLTDVHGTVVRGILG